VLKSLEEIQGDISGVEGVVEALIRSLVNRQPGPLYQIMMRIQYTILS